MEVFNIPRQDKRMLRTFPQSGHYGSPDLTVYISPDWDQIPGGSPLAGLNQAFPGMGRDGRLDLALTPRLSSPIVRDDHPITAGFADNSSTPSGQAALLQGWLRLAPADSPGPRLPRSRRGGEQITNICLEILVLVNHVSCINRERREAASRSLVEAKDKHRKDKDTSWHACAHLNISHPTSDQRSSRLRLFRLGQRSRACKPSLCDVTYNIGITLPTWLYHAMFVRNPLETNRGEKEWHCPVFMCAVGKMWQQRGDD
ncbi:hypothetical protein Bbelb_177030 [Branchiostoma belcheri]|nr:hypothetical protein Bbelb_177030 [Branchiostoma belcheri]